MEGAAQGATSCEDQLRFWAEFSSLSLSVYFFFLILVHCCMSRLTLYCMCWRLLWCLERPAKPLNLKLRGCVFSHDSFVNMFKIQLGPALFSVGFKKKIRFLQHGFQPLLSLEMAGCVFDAVTIVCHSSADTCRLGNLLNATTAPTFLYPCAKRSSPLKPQNARGCWHHQPDIPIWVGAGADPRGSAARWRA